MQNGSMKPVSWKKVALFVFLFPTVSFVFIIFKNSVYLISEFIFVSNSTNYSEQCKKMEEIERRHIPSIIHQIHGFKDSQMKKDHLVKIQTWKEKHSDYLVYLWNATTVNKLIENEYRKLKRLFMSYGSWIQRADVARYVILYHYGGWYIDLDVRCKSGLHELVAQAYQEKKSGVFHTTFPYGTSNDIFGITNRHPLLKSVLDNLPNANRWYILPHWNILLSTGSTYMWGRILNYPCKDDFMILGKEEYLKYFQIEHDGSWHSWDDRAGLMIINLLNNTYYLLIILMVPFCIIFLTFARCKGYSKNLYFRCQGVNGTVL